MPNYGFSCGQTRFFPDVATAVLFTKVSKECTDLDLSILYILLLGAYSKFTRKHNFLALGV